jgi:hypothetical protein
MPVFLHALHAGVVGIGVLAVAVLLRPLPRPARARVAELRSAATGGTLIESARARAQAQLGTVDRVATIARPRAVQWQHIAASGCLVAAVVHAVVCPEHFREATRLGVFFLAITIVQLVLARGLLRDPTRRWAVYCAIVNAGTVLLWAAVHMTGLPFGLAELESIGYPDITATFAEVLAVAAAVTRIRGR